MKMNKSNSSPINIIILGSGFAAIEALKKLQKKYKNNSNVDIKIISRVNILVYSYASRSF